MRGLTEHVAWVFPDSGLLSKEWLQRLWDFLENHPKSDEGEQVCLDDSM